MHTVNLLGGSPKQAGPTEIVSSKQVCWWRQKLKPVHPFGGEVANKSVIQRTETEYKAYAVGKWHLIMKPES
ncbi:MAG: hypothetical protein ABI761_07330 [Saprospiraceae bacterium]